MGRMKLKKKKKTKKIGNIESHKLITKNSIENV